MSWEKARVRDKVTLFPWEGGREAAAAAAVAVGAEVVAVVVEVAPMG